MVLGQLLSDIKLFPQNLRLRNPILFYLGGCLWALSIFFLIAFAVCHYSIYELCHWLKPGKFTFSFAVYAATLGWFLYYLRGSLSATTLKALSWIITVVITLEMVIMLIQSWMSSTSYFSLQVPLAWTQLFLETSSLLGSFLILANTGIALFIGTQFFRSITLQPAMYLWAIRASFAIFLLSCFLGLLIMVYYGPTEANSEDLSIPFTQISIPRNNLISMHFLGIHLMQIVPFMTYYFQNYLGKKFLISTLAFYSLGCFAIFLQIYF
jgi:hypothetical protein